MLDDSITSSPSKSNKSIHKVRLLRKNKRKQIKENIRNPDHKTETKENIILFDFYKNSEDELDDAVNRDRNGTFLISKPSAIIENYKPFEMEKRLAMADRLTSNQRDDESENKFPEKQGFTTCQPIKEIDGLTSLTKQESSFLITESELINCCYQAEKVFKGKEPNLQKHKIEDEISSSSLIIQPSPPIQLVNSILQDFSQSPLTKDQSVIYTSWQHTPEFRLRRKPIKTYSRKCLSRTRTNLTKRLESVTSDGGNSNCSSLSTQEGVAPLEGVFNSAITDTSERVCLNLLNLSAFFTQNSASNSSPDQNDQNSFETFLLPSSQEKLLNNISSIKHEICKFRSSCPEKLRTNSYSSDQDFFGFPSHKEQDINAIDLVVDNKNVHLNNTLIEHIIPLEEQKMDLNSKVNVEYNNWIEDGCEGVFAGINIDTISLQKDGFLSDQNSHKLEKNKKQLIQLPKFLENDGEILTNKSLMPTQNSIKFMGFKTASSKTIKVSRKAHIMAAKILSKLPDIPIKSKINNYDNRVVTKDSTTKDVNIFENPDDYEWNDDCDFFINFKTPTVSNDKQHIDKIVNEKFIYTNDFPSTSKMASKTNIGFQTAAGKNVAISKKAQQSVQSLLKQFEIDIIENEDSDELKEMKMKIYTKNHNVKTQKTNLQNKKELRSNHQCNRNETNKNFNESHDKNSSNLEELLDERDTIETNRLLKENMGFQTAQGENIKIPTKAQQSVERIFKEFVIDPNEHFESDITEMKDKTKADVSKPITDVYNLQETNTQSEKTNEISNNNIELQTVYGEQIMYSTNALQSIELAKKGKNKQEKLRDGDIEIQQQNFVKNPLNEKNISQSANGKKVLIAVHENSITLNNGDIANIAISSNNGFRTAKGNKVAISAKAQQAVDKMLQEFHSDLTATNNDVSLIDMKAKIEKKNQQLKQHSKYLDLKSTQDINEYSNMIFSEWSLNSKKDLTQNSTPKQLNKRKLSLDNSDVLSPITARSPSTKLINEKLHSTKSLTQNSSPKQFNKRKLTLDNCDVPSPITARSPSNKLINERLHSTKSLTQNSTPKQLNKRKLSLDNSDVPSPITARSPSTKLINERLHSTKSLTQNSTPKQFNKRKLTLDNSDVPSPITARSPSTKLINEGLHSAKSLFNELTIKSPLNSSPAASIMSRKNLLSLTKRRKNKKNSVTNVNQDSNEKEIPKIYKELVETPIKSSTGTSIQTPATPNLKEFFSKAPQTSTPREEHKVSKSVHKSMIQDFKPINWDTINDTVVNKSKLGLANRSTKLSDSICSNITLNSSNPTAQERIARLKMYGKPPAVSPILIDTHNSCRPSGLRRTRSMLKKAENK